MVYYAFKELSQNMSTMFTAIDKELSEMKGRPAVISDDQVCKLIDGIGGYLTSPCFC
jgi:hypothetical protein